MNLLLKKFLNAQQIICWKGSFSSSQEIWHEMRCTILSALHKAIWLPCWKLTTLHIMAILVIFDIGGWCKAITQRPVKIFKNKSKLLQENIFVDLCVNLWLKIQNTHACRSSLLNSTSENFSLNSPANSPVVIYLFKNPQLVT